MQSPHLQTHTIHNTRTHLLTIHIHVYICVCVMPPFHGMDNWGETEPSKKRVRTHTTKGTESHKKKRHTHPPTPTQTPTFTFRCIQGVEPTRHATSSSRESMRHREGNSRNNNQKKKQRPQTQRKQGVTLLVVHCTEVSELLRGGVDCVVLAAARSHDRQTHRGTQTHTHSALPLPTEHH